MFKKRVVHVQSCCLRLYSKPIAFLSFPSRKRLNNLSSPCRSRFEVTLNLVILRRSLQDDKQTYKTMHLLCFSFWASLITDKRHNSKIPGFLFMHLWISFLKWGYTTSGLNHHCKAHLPGVFCAWAPNSTHEFIMRFGRLRKKALFLVKSRIYFLCISSTTPGHFYDDIICLPPPESAEDKQQEAAEAFWNLW